MIERYINPPETLEQVLAGLEPGDVLMLDAGEYRVNLLLDRPCVIRGVGAATLLQGSPGTGPVVRVSAQGVRLEQLALEHLGDRGVVLEVDPGIRVQLDAVQNLAGRVKGTRSLEAVAALPPLSRTLSAEQARPWPFETPEFPPKPEEKLPASREKAVVSTPRQVSKQAPAGAQAPTHTQAHAQAQPHTQAHTEAHTQAQAQAHTQAHTEAHTQAPTRTGVEGVPFSPGVSVEVSAASVPIPAGLFPPPAPLSRRIWRALQASAGMWAALFLTFWQHLKLSLWGRYQHGPRPGWREQVLAAARADGTLLRVRAPGHLELRHADGTLEPVQVAHSPKRPGLMALSPRGRWWVWLELEGTLHAVALPQGEGTGTSTGWTCRPLGLGLALAVLETPTPLVLLLTPEGVEAYDAGSGHRRWYEPLPIGAGGCLLVHAGGVWISNHAGRSWYLELEGASPSGSDVLSAGV